jgi:hypothetical protein
MSERKKNAYRLLVGKPDGKKTAKKPKMLVGR